MNNVIAQSTTSANATIAMVSELVNAMPAVISNEDISTVTTHTVSATAKAADLAFTSTQKTLELLTHKREAWEQGAYYSADIPGTGKSALAALLPDAMEEARTGIAMNSGMKYIRVQPGNNGMTMLNAVGNQAQLVPFSSHHYFVFDEVDNLNAQAMLVLKSVMNTPNCVFILTTNNFQNVEVGVRSRCHCIPFNAAPAANWLPLAHRMLADAGITGITGIADQALIKVIDLCNGDARDIVTAIAALVLKVSRQRSAQSTAVV